MRTFLKTTCLLLTGILAFATAVPATLNAAPKPIEIHTFTGKVDVSLKGGNAGAIDFDITMHFRANEQVVIKDFTLATQSLACEKVEIDGKLQGHEVKSNIVSMKSSLSLKPGPHTARLKYKCETAINNPATARLQMITTPRHFHCYNVWYPSLTEMDYAPSVKFDMDISIPQDWFLLGAWVPREYREKPKSDGRYKFVREYMNPYDAKLVGGSYNVLKGGDDDAVIWVYTFRGESGDAAYIAEQGQKSARFFEDYLGHKGSGEYIIGAQTGRRGNGQGIDGGFVMDSPSLVKEYFQADFLAHEMAHGWFGGVVKGVETQPDNRIISESFAEFAALEYCRTNTDTAWYNSMLAQKHQAFWSSHTKYEPALTSENCTWMDTIVYNKGSFVLQALKGFMGADRFMAGLRMFIERFSLIKNKSKARATLMDFKAVMDEANGSPIDRFWKTFFESGALPVPQLDVVRGEDSDNLTDTLRCKNLEATDYPINITVYGLDGKPVEKVFEGASMEFKVPGGIGGFAILPMDSIIPKPGLNLNSLGSSTIAAALAWGTPQVVSLEDKSPRALSWSGMLKAEIHKEPDYSKPGAVVLVGDDAIGKFASESLRQSPVKPDGKGLVWHQDKFTGQFGMVCVLPDQRNGNLPVILDNGRDNLPEDLSWAGIFKQTDGPNTLFFRNQADGVVSPPKLKLMEAGWSDIEQTVYDSRIDLSISNAQDCKVSYEGFDPEGFVFGKLEKTYEKPSVNDTIYIDFRGSSDITLRKQSRFAGQVISQILKYSGKARDFMLPANLVVPKSVSGSQIGVKWNGQTKFIYRLDGQASSNWETGESLLLQNISKGKHKLSIVFYHEGWLSPIHDFEIEAGANPPRLEIFTKNPICQNGKVEIKGKTDPDCTIDPPATISADGSFTLTVSGANCPESLKVTARNKSGLEISQTVKITKRITLTMHIGSSIATDETGQSFAMPVPPQSIKGTTYVPMRFIGERLGARILWDDFTKQVTYMLGDTTVEIIIGKSEARVNGVVVKMSAPAIVQSGRTLVPVRFVAEALGAAVSYDPATKKIVIAYPK